MRVLLKKLIFLFVFAVSFAAQAQNNDLEITPQVAHQFDINISKLHPNGRWLLTGSSDKTIKLWDIYENKLIRTFVGHSGMITSLDFHPNTDSFYMMSTAEEDNNLITWDLNSGVIHSQRKLPYNFAIESVAYDESSNGAFYYVFGYKEIQKCVTATGKVGVEIKLPNSLIDGDADASEMIDGLYGLDKKLNGGRISYINGLKKIALRYYNKLYLIDKNDNVDSLDCESLIYDFNYNKTLNRLAVTTEKALIVWDLNTHIKIYNFKNKFNNSKIILSQSGNAFLARLGDNVNAVYDMKAHKLIQTFDKLAYDFATFVQNDKYILVCGAQGYPRVFKVADKKERKFNTFYNPIAKMALSPNKQFLCVADQSNSIKILNRSTLKVEHQITNFYGDITALAYSDNGQYLAAGSSDLYVRVWDVNTYQLVNKFQINEPENGTNSNGSYYLSNVIFDSDNRFIFTGIQSRTTLVKKGSRVYKYDWSNGLKVAESNYFESWIGKIELNKKYNTLAVISTDDLRILKAENLKTVKKVKENVVFYDNVTFSDDGNILMASAWGNIFAWQYPDFKLIKKFDYQLGYAWALKIINDSIALAAGGFDDYRLHVLNFKLGTTVKREIAHDNRVENICIDGNVVITASLDGKIIFWDKSTQQQLATMMLLTNKDEYIIYNSDGYYMASKKALDMISFTHNKLIFNISAFDLEKNRPDILLRTIGYNSQALADIYYQLYQKRKANSPSQLQWNGNDIPIIERAILPYQINDTFVALRIQATQSVSALNRLNIWLNGVPIFGKNGIEIKATNGKFDSTYRIELQNGVNIVEYTVYNLQGMQSEKPKLEIECLVKAKRSNLYVLCLSVSEYEQKENNLKYAVKDGRDVAQAFIQEYLSQDVNNLLFNQIFVDTLFDKNATVQNFLKAESKIKEAQPSDRVIVYLSGHGLLDKNLNFWFATHNIDFKNPSKDGLGYERVEELLSNINAREKLLLIDACHSGQPDKSAIVKVDESKLQNSRNVQSYTFKGLELDDEELPDLSASFELMQVIFRDMSLSGGTQVIAAAAGNSYALESDLWNNGIFTYCLVNGIKNKEADLNADGKINLSELNEYIYAQVSSKTSGRQKPTSRSWNQWADFIVK